MTVALVAAAPALVARQVIAQHSKSFALASRLLGPRVRDQAAVIYTWCRRADDAVDEDHGGHAAIELLDRELASAYEDRAVDPVLAAFGAVARERELPILYPRELLAGMAMDVEGVTYGTLEQLITYAWRVAGVVGLMMTHVFGLSDDDAVIHAAHLGIAMQLTNICRDVGEDWQRGRLYLPDELLAQYGAGGLANELGKPLPASARTPVAATMTELLALADRYYRSGDRGVAALPWRAGLAVRAARRVYSAIGRKIARDGFELGRRAVVPGSTKLALVATSFARSTLAAPRHLGQRYHIPRRTLELGDVPRL